MSATIVNLAAIPPAPPVPGLATGGTSGMTVNTPGVPLGPGGVPTGGQPIPQSTPVVSALPASGDPLSVIGQYVIFNSQVYIYTAGISGGPNYWALDTTAAPSIRDVWANLGSYPAANYPVGTVFEAIDRTVSYSVQQLTVKTWIYYNGIYEAPLASIPGDLGPTSRGFVFRASDYLHNWIWSGSGWSFTTGGIGVGTLRFANPGPPDTNALWQLCDGSTVGVSQDDGTILATAMPTTPNTWFAR